MRIPRRAFLGLAAGVAAVSAGLSGRPSTTRAVAAETKLRYLPGSSTKIEQLIGDVDYQTQQPTTNQTAARYGLIGTDLGSSFEHNGKVYFVFGDSMGPGARDPIAYSTATDPEAPLALEFFSDKPGQFLPILPQGVRMGPFEVPAAGISLNGSIYVVVISDYTEARDRHSAKLVQFDEAALAFRPVREISRLPAGRFLHQSLVLGPPGLEGMPGAAQYVMQFGAGVYRSSDLFLAAAPAESFTSGAGTVYFRGMDGTTPLWSDQETDAAPVIAHPQFGNSSTVYLAQLGLWLVLYDSRDPANRGVLMRYAPMPWGPWSAPQIAFQPLRDKALGAFIHDVNQPDVIAGPVTGRNDPRTTAGGAYGPYIINRFTSVTGTTLTLHYLLSTWNPYTVVRMKSSFAIE